MPDVKPHSIRCDRCGHTCSYQPESFARMGGKCRYCGAGLAVPEEWEAEWRGSRGRLSQRTVEVACTVCGRTRQAPAVGELWVCGGCGCPHIAPDQDGPGLDPWPWSDARGRSAAVPPSQPVNAACPSCRGRVRLPGNWVPCADGRAGAGGSGEDGMPVAVPVAEPATAKAAAHGEPPVGRDRTTPATTVTGKASGTGTAARLGELLAAIGGPSASAALPPPGAVSWFACPLCRRHCDLGSADLRTLFPTALGGDPLGRLVETVLEARRSQGRLSLGEAAETIEMLRRLADWDPAPIGAFGRPARVVAGGAPAWVVSPLPPALTADLARALLLGNPDTIANPLPDGTIRVRMFLGSRAAFCFTRPDMASVSLGLKLGLMLGPAGVLLANGETRRDEASLLLDFAPDPDGCELSVRLQRADGSTATPEFAQAETVAAGISARIGAEATAWLAFRSLYGPWVTPSMAALATTECVAARILRYCPGSSPAGAQRLARCLVPAARVG